MSRAIEIAQAHRIERHSVKHPGSPGIVTECVEYREPRLVEIPRRRLIPRQIVHAAEHAQSPAPDDRRRLIRMLE